MVDLLINSRSKWRGILMIPTNKESISIHTIREKGKASILAWFEQHIRSFYTLGLCYLGNEQQIEELFYRTILKVQKGLPRFKNKISFEVWVTSIFIDSCRELSRDRSLQSLGESEQAQGLFRALERLKQDEKEAVIFTYVQQLSHEKAAHLLQVSTERMKELLSSGIKSLRNDMWSGEGFHGCEEYQKDYLAYLERTMERPKKVDFEVHIYHCQNCQDDLATFQELMFILTDQREDVLVPADFMVNVKERLKENELHQEQKLKKRKKTGFVFVSVFVLLMALGFFTGAFTKLYYEWTEEDLELRAFLQHGLGQSVSLEAEHDGVKIKIKGVIADDLQTLVFYEIEDMSEDNQYILGFGYGNYYVENEYEVMNRGSYPVYYAPNLEAEINNKEENVYHGKVSLLPLKEENETINLKITELRELVRDTSDPNHFWGYGNGANKMGEWSFEIPVTKQPLSEHTLDEEIEIEGIPIRFDKLIIAPTATILQVGINNEQLEKRIDHLDFDHLKVNNQEAHRHLYGSAFVSTEYDMNWNTLQTQFEPLFGEAPKEVSIQLKAAYLTFDDVKTIELDDNQDYPRTFDYAGSTISIDKQEVGQYTNIVISNHEIENRAYENLYLSLAGEDGNLPVSTEINFEGVVVDKHGVEYDMNQNPFFYEELEQPRYYYTSENYRIPRDEMTNLKLKIYGYRTTKYMDDVVKISLK